MRWRKLSPPLNTSVEIISEVFVDEAKIYIIVMRLNFILGKNVYFHLFLGMVMYMYIFCMTMSVKQRK